MFALMGSKALAGSVAGYMTGRFARIVTDWAIFYAGLGILFVAGLHYIEWITINWKKIDNDVLQLAAEAQATADNSGLTARFKQMLIKTTPLMVGFATGFYIAFISSSD